MLVKLHEFLHLHVIDESNIHDIREEQTYTITMYRTVTDKHNE
jgi:hypothetical protein